MCGITGAWGPADSADRLRENGRRMSDPLRHRGPDAGGCWVDADAGLVLGHRRLSILDLSEEGSQPMVSPGGRFVISYNGEVYNFGEIRRELERRSEGAGPHFRGHSDTEVMLAAIEAWGLEAAVGRFVGMFAFALWDRQTRALHLVRDRLGIKPLYYGWCGEVLLFGSELKALRAHPGWNAEVDRDALALLLRYDCIPAPYSIYRGIHKLMPGHILTLRAPSRASAQAHAYWSAAEVVARGARDPFRGTDEEAVSHLDGLLREAVRLRMIADVPVGAFLSGGIDSSCVVALAQAQSTHPVKTFTMGFESAEYNEAEHAREVAAHLGTEHTELMVTPEEAAEVIPRLPVLYDEPFADVSQIPTFLVSALARQQVTVSLSGDGGDELFAGYNRHAWGPAIWRRIRRVPRSVRGLAARALVGVPPETWDRSFQVLEPVLPGPLRHRMPGYKIHKLAEVLDAESAEAMYQRLASQWQRPLSVVRNATEPPVHALGGADGAGTGGFAERMMYLDLVSYLPDDILTKVDRASMGVSLEARVPLLDHRVVEFAWRMPLEMKLRQGTTKWALRQVLYRYVPQELVERPKSGFGPPLGEWLRGPLREWAEELLDEDRLRREGYFHPEPIRAAWRDHLAGKRSQEYPLWDVLMFQSWLEAQQAGVEALV